MSALLEGLQGDGKEILSPLFERHARERALRRPLQDRAVPYREVSFVARALQPVMFSRVVDRAGEMGALLTVSDVGIFPRAHQNAGVPHTGVIEDLGSPNRDLTHLGYGSGGISSFPGKPGAEQNP